MQWQGCAAGIAEFRGLRILTIAAWTPHDLRRSSLLQFVPMVLVPRQQGEDNENRTGKANAASVHMRCGAPSLGMGVTRLHCHPVITLAVCGE